MVKNIFRQHALFITLILVNILFAVFFGIDFGDSWDEQLRYRAALKAIDQYARLQPAETITDKGPAYIVFAKFGGDFIQLFFPSLSHIQAWHYVHFFTFLIALVSFYIISLRFLSPGIAFAATMLFNTQPVIFGHAFMNPKDIPVMASFLLIVAIGFSMVDRYPRSAAFVSDKPGLSGTKRRLVEDWVEQTTGQKIVQALYILIVILALIFLTVFSEIMQQAIQAWINGIRNTRLFDLINQGALFLLDGGLADDLTLENVKTAYPFFLFLIAGLFSGVFFILAVWLYPRTVKKILGLTTRRELLSGFHTAAQNPWIYPAGIVLGLSISNRTISITAGVFVLLYLWVKKRSVFLQTTFIYLGIGILILYLSWPGLWGHPILGLIKNIQDTSSFYWAGEVLFQGNLYDPSELPSYYLPLTIAIQLTIPALVLFLLGVGHAVQMVRKKTLEGSILMIFSLWLLVPLSAAFVVQPTVYDNFRHFLFIIPPIFFFAGIGLRGLARGISHEMLTILLVCGILSFGTAAIVQLHPYQYVYYNEFVGGVEGAFRRFELDYWATAYRECTEYINQEAEANQTILVKGPDHIVKNYAREDLAVIRYREVEKAAQFQAADYAMITSRQNHDQTILPDLLAVYTVERSGAVLAVVRSLQGGK